MTFAQWQKKFLSALNGMSKQEKLSALEYYQEIYGDKVDVGQSPDDIIAEFGNPVDCAKKILAENSTQPQAKKTKEKVSVHSVSYVVAMVFLTLLVVIPVFVVLFSIVVSFGSLVLAGAVSAIASSLFTLLSPIYFVWGASWQGVLSYASVGLGFVGAGTLLAIGFYFPTKYMAIISIKLFKKIYFKGE